MQRLFIIWITLISAVLTSIPAHALTQIEFINTKWHGGLENKEWGIINHIGYHCRDEQCAQAEIYVARCPAKFNQTMKCELVALGSPEHFCDLKLTQEILDDKDLTDAGLAIVSSAVMLLAGPMVSKLIGEQAMNALSSINSVREIVENIKAPTQKTFGCFDNKNKDFHKEKDKAYNFAMETIEKAKNPAVVITSNMNQADAITRDFRYLISPLVGDRVDFNIRKKQNFYSGTVTAKLTCSEFIDFNGKKICDPKSNTIRFESELQSKPFELQMQEKREQVLALDKKYQEEDNRCRAENGIAAAGPRPLWGTVSCQVKEEPLVAAPKKPLEESVKIALASASNRSQWRKSQDLEAEITPAAYIPAETARAIKADATAPKDWKPYNWFK